MKDDFQVVEPFYYKFEDFCVDPQRRLLLRADQPIAITDRAFDTLIVLLENFGQIVERERFFQEVWQDVAVEPNNLDQSIYVLRNALKDTKEPRQFIKSVTKRGFIFLKHVEIITVSPINLTEPEIILPSSEPVRDAIPLAETGVTEVATANQRHTYLGHIATSSALYALLYSIALLLEVSYKFDDFVPAAIELAVLIFLTVFAASFGGLRLIQKRTLEGHHGGLVLASLLFVIMGLLVYGLLGFFLPGSAITEANFQTYSAHAAYLKNVSVFLALALVFMIIPFHFVHSLKREINTGKHRSAQNLLLGKRRGVVPAGAIFLRPWWLVALLIIAVVGSQIAMSHIIDNLKPGSHMNLFTALAEARRLNYFTLAIESLVWYNWALNDLRNECQKVLSHA